MVSLPREIAERRQRRDQHVKTLARYHGADRQQPYDAVLTPVRPWHWIAARPCDDNMPGWHAVIGRDQLCRGRAGNDDTFHRCERGSLARAQRVGLRRRQPPFQRQRMMHQCQQRIAVGKLQRRFRQNAERQPIDDDGAFGGHGQIAASAPLRASLRWATESLRRGRADRSPSRDRGVRRSCAGRSHSHRSGSQDRPARQRRKRPTTNPPRTRRVRHATPTA